MLLYLANTNTNREVQKRCVLDFFPTAISQHWSVSVLDANNQQKRSCTRISFSCVSFFLRFLSVFTWPVRLCTEIKFIFWYVDLKTPLLLASLESQEFHLSFAHTDMLLHFHAVHRHANHSSPSHQLLCSGIKTGSGIHPRMNLRLLLYQPPLLQIPWSVLFHP